ncbi:MAG: serine/threonine protein kinase, partial [Myxococcales bacterium]|nr:serine/threonine protein kinase [Myxococcales bacterium]
MIDESGTLDADLGPRQPARGDTPVAAGQAAPSTDSSVGDLGSAPTLHSDEVPAAGLERSSLPPKIDRFVVLRELGAGGMGVVAEAYDPELDRKIAIKLLRGDRSRPESPLRLLREAQALARLSHPNVVQIHDAGIDNGNVFIAMELVPGQTLGAWLRGERPWREVVDLFLEVGAGLRAAHEQGLVHRDFKPENVLIGADGRPRVVDFGLAREHREAGAPAGASATLLDERLTLSGAIMGTPAYMAPEQWRGEEATALSDVFAFSVALFEGLYGQRPFRAETSAALLHAVVNGEITAPPPTRRVPAWLDAIVRRGLKPAPVDRFPSMDALLAALARDPGKTRRRVLGLAGLVTAVAALGIGIGMSSGGRADPCSGGAELLAEVWGEGPRAAVSDALAAEPLGEELRDTVVGGLDRYGDAWASAHRGACQAHLRGERSDALLDRQMSCLERRRRSIRASTEVLRTSEGVAVREAPLIVAKLPPIALCEDLDALGVDVPPTDPATAAQVAELRGELAELDVLASAGQTDAALAGIAAIRDRALGLGDPSILAEADLHEGRAALAAYAWERASARLRDALNEAIAAR